MTETIIPVPEDWKKRAFMDKAAYQAAYDASLKDPDAFWGKEAARLDWITPFTKVKNTSFDAADLHIKWFEDGALNVSANCIDRHLANARRPDRHHLGRRRSQADSKHITYRRTACARSAALPMC